MKTILARSVPIFSVAVLFAIGSSPLVFATSSTSLGVSVASPSILGNPLLKSVPVTLTFSPKTITLKHSTSCGSYYWCGPFSLAVHNKGTTTIVFNGCQFYYKLSTAAKYTKGLCSLGAGVTVPGGATLKGTVTVGAPSTAQKGTYDGYQIWTNAVDQSGKGTFEYVVP